ISAQVIDIASTEGAIIATKAAHAKLENISEPDRKAAIKVLEDKGKTDITPELIKDQIYKTAYNQALNESGFGTGGKYHTALQAATAAIQGLAGGNIGQALAGGASPYLAGVIKDLTTDPKTHQVDVVSNTLAHAILGAVAAEVSGNNALAGAAGAAGGELAARELMKHIHGENVKVSDLSEEEKQTISTLSTLAAGLAGGIAGDSTGSAVTGAQAGKNAVENNFLSFDEAHAFDKEMTACKAAGKDCQPVINKYAAIHKANSEQYRKTCQENPLVCAAGTDKAMVEGDVTEPENVFGLMAGGRSLFNSAASGNAKMIGTGLSMGANGAVQVANGNTGDKFDYLSLFLAGATGWSGTGRSLYANVGVNVGGAYLGSQVTSQNSEAAMVGAAFGTTLGYGMGSAITGKLEAAEIKNHFGMPGSYNALKYSDKPVYSNFLTNGVELSPAPSIGGDL
ncbi:VENN motif pre-toxin domain-containing protein, partial [Photorhabdus antumapuensis]|uniref:VENN motif pre-toxin domain-containing protein n=1 Tax=Photorhabdus antumapuensis TaxID=2862867 RepID=UPI001CED93C6